MQLKDQPAYPLAWEEQNEHGIKFPFVQSGVSHRIYLATKAPPVPDWFEPNAPTDELLLKQLEVEVSRRFDRWKQNLDWRHAYNRGAEKIKEQFDKDLLIWKTSRVVRWGLAYADAMLRELEKCDDPS